MCISTIHICTLSYRYLWRQFARRGLVASSRTVGNVRFFFFSFFPGRCSSKYTTLHALCAVDVVKKKTMCSLKRMPPHLRGRLYVICITRTRLIKYVAKTKTNIRQIEYIYSTARYYRTETLNPPWAARPENANGPGFIGPTEIYSETRPRIFVYCTRFFRYCIAT